MITAKPFTIRVVYIVPADVEPWPEAAIRATELLADIQHFFADEMSRHGYGPKTFAIAFDERGALDFRLFTSGDSKKHFELDPRTTCKRVVGGRSKREREIEICFAEAYSITAGRVSGAFARTKRKRAYLSALYLKLARREWLATDKAYGGEVFPWINPEPMMPDTLSWNRRGQTLADVSGAAFGVIAHELAHCFGQNHHQSEDDERERKGHLMGLGVRGFRGVFQPKLTADRCVLSKQDAQLLNRGPFFAVRNLGPRSSAFSI